MPWSYLSEFDPSVAILYVRKREVDKNLSDIFLSVLMRYVEIIILNFKMFTHLTKSLWKAFSQIYYYLQGKLNCKLNF